MTKDADRYWRQWEKLIEAAANFQDLFPGSVMVGGSAAAIHLKPRFSFDADHILSDLRANFEDVLEFLEGRSDWETARILPPKLILGNFQGVETGIRQLRRNVPLETETIAVHGKTLTLPTLAEMLRTKAWMILSRNAVRDYIDFVALSEKMGVQKTLDVLKNFDAYYSDLVRGSKASPLLQLIRQLAEPKPGDLDRIDLSHYKGIQPPYDTWEKIQRACGMLSVELADTLGDGYSYID